MDKQIADFVSVTILDLPGSCASFLAIPVSYRQGCQGGNEHT